MEKMIEFPGSA